MTRKIPFPTGNFTSIYDRMMTYDEHSGAGNTGWIQLNERRLLEEQNRQYVGFMNEAKDEVDFLLKQGISVLAQPSRHDSVAPEKNPPGDIPDNQVFITYTSPLGFSLRVPEGWSRKDDTNGVSFADKYGRIEVTVSETATPPTAATVKTGEMDGGAALHLAAESLTFVAGAHIEDTAKIESGLKKLEEAA